MKKKVLFLCIGNSCRSQMAEGFARRYGSDVIEAESAGLAPAAIVQPLTKKVMLEKNIDIEAQFPKDVTSLSLVGFDLVVNISGRSLPTRLPVEIRDWRVEDPIGRSEDFYLLIRDQIENLVMMLILEFRRQEMKRQPPEPRRAPRRRAR